MGLHSVTIELEQDLIFKLLKLTGADSIEEAIEIALEKYIAVCEAKENYGNNERTIRKGEC